MRSHTANSKRNAARRLSEASDYAQDMAADAAQTVEDAGTAAREMASDYYQQGRRMVRRSAADLEGVIEEYPIRSALVALGLGCLICAAIIRRSR